MDQRKIENLYIKEKQTVKEIAEKLNLSFWKVYCSMRESNIPRRSYSEANYVKYSKCKAGFKIKDEIDTKDELLKIAGVMLYWAEGCKGGFGIDFANSDSSMVKMFLLFLRIICGVAEDRLRVYLYAFEGQDLEELKSYWFSVTKIPLNQFTKPYVRKIRSSSNGRIMPNGLIHIRYYDKKLLQLILKWIDEYKSSFKDYFNGQVPE